MSNNDVGYEADNTYESASDLCGDLAVNAAMGDKNTTTEDSARYSQNSPAEDHVASNNDVFGYEVDNTYESAWGLCGDAAVDAAVCDKNNTTEDSAASNNCHHGYKGHEGKSKIEVVDTHPIYTSDLSHV